MVKFYLWLCVLLAATVNAGDGPIAIALHGGAGTILKEEMTEEKEAAYGAVLTEAVERGYAMLAEGRSGLDVVVEVIVMLEDSPLFNAGKGSVFTHDGTHELDASIMVGHDHDAGAVAGVTGIRNPIRLARLVMEQSPHVMLSGDGAEAFAKLHDVERANPSYFYTKQRWEALQKALAGEKKKDAKHGTVGVAVLDRAGNLYAGTSTGGMTNKRWGRIGDSPVIGAGTWADDKTCAVSATGHGEYFIRAGVARDISARMAYAGEDLQTAADKVIQGTLTKMGGTGGIIAVDHRGEVAISFNTPGMYRAWRKQGGKAVIGIYRD